MIVFPCLGLAALAVEDFGAAAVHGVVVSIQVLLTAETATAATLLTDEPG